jgi:SAM-dependent methyltransferase
MTDEAKLASSEVSSLAAGWFETDLGRHLLDSELSWFDQTVPDIFGFNALQAGLPGIDLMRASRIPFRFRIGEGKGDLLADPTELPLPSQSLDLLLLPHVLEFSPHPHRILREAERVLMPEGRLLVSGFNPLSLWGITRLLKGPEAGYPWSGRFIHLTRLKDWLALLGLEFAAGRMCCYAPPIPSEKWLRRLRFMELAGDRWWAMGGGVYFIHAVKRVRGVRLITPAWGEKAAAKPALASAARKVANLRLVHTEANEP